MRSTRTILAGTVASVALLAGAAVAQPGNGHGNGGGQDKAAHGNSNGGGQAKGNGGGQAKGNGGGQSKGNGGGQPNGNGGGQSRGNGGGQPNGNGGGQSKGNGGGPSNGNGGNQQARSNGNGNGNARNDTRQANAGNNGGNGPSRQGNQSQKNGNGNNGGGNNGRGNDGARANTAQRDRSTVAHRTPRQDIKQVSYDGPKGNKITVPTNDRVRVVTSGTPVRWSRIDSRPSYDGCPPGLAKKYNGCTPPGLDRSPSQSWLRPSWYGDDYNRSNSYRYVDGYMVQVGSGSSILSYIPLLAGALAVGNVWPGSTDSVALPDYYDSYYGLGGSDSYRYYGDTIYRVDPGSNQINSVAALMMGNDIAIGQPMPTGYDVYNVPYGYRDQYYDTPDSLYRYSDGYIYQLDPTTRLVQAAIELLV